MLFYIDNDCFNASKDLYLFNIDNFRVKHENISKNIMFSRLKLHDPSEKV